MTIVIRIIDKLQRLFENQRINKIKKRFKSCGRDVIIYPSCFIIVPERFEIGDNSSIAPYTTIFATFGVKIGNNCLISSNCGISSYNHITNSSNRRRDESLDHKFSKPVIIENNVWIGMNVCVLPGVIIGDNSIIGSGSVVTKCVPSNEIWVGNPARFLRRINPEREY